MHKYNTKHEPFKDFIWFWVHVKLKKQQQFATTNPQTFCKLSFFFWFFFFSFAIKLIQNIHKLQFSVKLPLTLYNRPTQSTHRMSEYTCIIHPFTLTYLNSSICTMCLCFKASRFNLAATLLDSWRPSSSISLSCLAMKVFSLSAIFPCNLFFNSFSCLSFCDRIFSSSAFASCTEES